MESPASFLARNAVEVSPEGALKERLEAGRPLRVKLGLDPTAPDLHLGHTVVLQKLREFQDLGHTVVLIVGDYTARVGDPSGRSATRPVLSPEEIDAHAATYLAQATKVLADDERLEVRRNSEWLDMKMEELFRIVRTVTIARLLERDDFAKRMAAAEPISLLEFLYPVLQGYDSVAVRADVELGGTDQTFNLHMGRALQSSYGQPSQIVLTLPLLNGLDGTRKMSKSFGNQIGITDPPETMYGRTLSIPDELIESWYGLLLGTAGAGGRGPARREARARTRARRTIPRRRRSGGGRGGVRPGLHRNGRCPEHIDEVELSANGGELHLPQVIVELFGGSRSEARRKLQQGGVKLDGEPMPADPLDVPADALDGRVMQLGKRQFRRIKISSAKPL